MSVCSRRLTFQEVSLPTRSCSFHCLMPASSLNFQSITFFPLLFSVCLCASVYIKCTFLWAHPPPALSLSHCALRASDPLHLSLISVPSSMALLCPTWLYCTDSQQERSPMTPMSHRPPVTLLPRQNVLQQTHSPFHLDFYNSTNPYFTLPQTLYLIAQVSLLCAAFPWSSEF